MRWLILLPALLITLLLLPACGKTPKGNSAGTGTGAATQAGGSGPADEMPHDGDHDEAAGGHGHDETPLGTTTIDGVVVTCAQGHGLVEPGKLCHLVVKLPYNDGGETIVRAWIGTEERDLYLVSKGDYAASHDDYDVHAEAPDPLPDDARWWIEIQKPDGTRVTGSIGLLR